MFYLKKLRITGNGKTDSEIEFVNGLNIIYGPSDTGKTCVLRCIDYLFGADEVPFKDNYGYDTIDLEIFFKGSLVTLTRKLKENRIQVKSQSPEILDSEYFIKKDPKISSFWLQLIDIKEQLEIITNTNWKKAKLTWRTFQHIVFLSETRIIDEQSILLSDHGYTAVTKEKSALYFLATGENFANQTEQTRKEISKARSEAVIDYLEKEISASSSRKQILGEQLQQYQNIDIPLELDNLTAELENIEREIQEKIRINQKVLETVSEQETQLITYRVLYDRYINLKSQYEADQRRLSFIVDGILKEEHIEHTHNCPFCNSKIEIEDDGDYVPAAIAEYQKIDLQLVDLSGVIQELHEKISVLEGSIAESKKRYQNVRDLISKQLSPTANHLKNKLDDYKIAIEIQKELAVLESQVEDRMQVIEEKKRKEDKAIEYHPSEYYGDIVLSLNKTLKNILEKCHYSALQDVRFDRNSMDILVNGQEKKTFGKGYRAYFNSIVALAFMHFLKTEGKYCPSLLLCDSPILSLKERLTPDNEVPTSTMREGLFEEFQQKSREFQIIIVENEIPTINYEENTNWIKFTKDKGTGRYGFLMDVF